MRTRNRRIWCASHSQRWWFLTRGGILDKNFSPGSSTVFFWLSGLPTGYFTSFRGRKENREQYESEPVHRHLNHFLNLTRNITHWSNLIINLLNLKTVYVTIPTFPQGFNNITSPNFSHSLSHVNYASLYFTHTYPDRTLCWEGG